MLFPGGLDQDAGDRTERGLRLLLLLEQRATVGAPAVPVLANPVEQRALKADVVAQALGLEPLVAEDLFPLGEEFLIQRGLLYELA